MVGKTRMLEAHLLERRERLAEAAWNEALGGDTALLPVRRAPRARAIGPAPQRLRSPGAPPEVLPAGRARQLRPPRPVPLFPRRAAPPGHLCCPERPEGPQPLVQHVILPAECRRRQSAGYHKCWQCEHREGSSAGTLRLGLPELDNGPGRGPRPDGASSDRSRP